MHSLEMLIPHTVHLFIYSGPLEGYRISPSTHQTSFCPIVGLYLSIENACLKVIDFLLLQKFKQYRLYK